MASTIRPIVIDDTDTAIKYTGQGWFEDPVGDGPGNWGTPYLHTRHGTTSNDSFSFSFTGTYISVFGTTSLSEIPIVNGTGTGNGTTWDPKWECFIDGVSIGYAELGAGHGLNNWKLCEGQSQLADGHHTLTLNVTTMGNTFWFDQLRFTPSPGNTYGNGTNVVMIDIDDPAIQYGYGWKPWSYNVNITATSQLKLNFTGTSLSWYGMVPPGDPNTPPFATYSIDGGSSVPFKVTPNPIMSNFYQLFFTTPSLSPAEHSLLVGANSTLDLMYFYVTNVTIPSSGSVGSQSGGVAPSSGSSPTSGSSGRLGPILGGVFSGIFLVSLLLFFLYRQRKRWQDFPQQTDAFVTTREASPFLSSAPIIPNIQQSALAPFSTPLPYAISSDQLGGDSPYFARLHVKNATPPPSGTHCSSTQGTGGFSLGNNSPEQTGVTSTSGWVPHGGGQSLVVQHYQDSGLRTGSDMTRVDIPPAYTPD